MAKLPIRFTLIAVYFPTLQQSRLNIAAADKFGPPSLIREPLHLRRFADCKAGIDSRQGNWDLRTYIQKFPDWSPEPRTANGTILCHWMQL